MALIDEQRATEGLRPSHVGRHEREIPRGSPVVYRGKTVADRPDLLAQWDDEGNGSLRPDSVRLSRPDPVNWPCRAHEEQGHLHRWPAPVASRARGTRCPYCTGRLVCPGNSLAGMYPDIAAEWHPTANAPLTPDDVIGGSKHDVVWLCPEGHAYPKRISARTKQGQGCRECEEAGHGERIRKRRRETEAERREGRLYEAVDAGADVVDLAS